MERFSEARRFAWTAHVVAVTLVAAFWVPAVRATHGAPPAPLDDVFIHFDFARSLAHGYPLTWLVGNGYSSGGTSLLYPVILAPAWALGLRGQALGWFAGAVAIASVADLLRSVFALCARAPRWARWCAPIVVVAVPFVDWSLCSGMEVALFGAVLGRAAVAVRRVERAEAIARPRAQLRAGVWLAALIATRPESAAIALPLAVAVAHASGALDARRAFARAIGPSAVLVASMAGLNRFATGDWLTAGAVRKLLSTNPYAAPVEIAVEVVKNLVVLREQALGAALGAAALVPIALVACAALDRRARRVAIAIAIGAVMALGLVSLTSTARFQNLRYAAPVVLALLVASAVGAASLARRGRLGAVAAAALLGLLAIAPAAAFPFQIERFSRASANIVRQQVEVGRRLAALHPRRVFVNDAGAIPYVSGVPAIDGLGLGGFRVLPFARASVHGPAAVLELIERLRPEDRPDVLAIYPGWWRGLDALGPRRFSVKIEDNVICGDAEVDVFDADLSALTLPTDRSREGTIDELDVGDLVSEAEHDHTFDGPHAGYVVGATLALSDGKPRWDAGRVYPTGRAERFRVREGVAPGPARLIVRMDAGPPLVLVAHTAGRAAVRRKVPARVESLWHEVDVELPFVRAGEVISLRAESGVLRDFHVWLVRR